MDPSAESIVPPQEAFQPLPSPTDSVSELLWDVCGIIKERSQGILCPKFTSFVERIDEIRMTLVLEVPTVDYTCDLLSIQTMYNDFPISIHPLVGNWAPFWVKTIQELAEAVKAFLHDDTIIKSFQRLICYARQATHKV